MADCLNCGFPAPRLRRGRCDGCYRFWLGHGRDRDPQAAGRLRDLRQIRELERGFVLSVLDRRMTGA